MEPDTRPARAPDIRPDIHAREPATRPALWDSMLRGADVGRPGHASVTRASSWLSRLVRRLAMIAVVLGIGLVALIYFVARALG